METESEKKSVSSQLHENMWGHRFTEGQKGTDYTLEFLNVLAGANYELSRDYYVKKQMLLFRQFVFEGYKSGREQGSYVMFSEENKQKLMNDLKCTANEIEDIKDFFKNMIVQRTLTGNRSWYAYMLFPLNESLLFFELRDDKGKIVYERNFFSRGGELYYLMLSYGTQHDITLRMHLQERIQAYMQGNENIGKLVKAVAASLNEKACFDETDPKNVFLLQPKENHTTSVPSYTSLSFPKLPKKDLVMYQEFAEDLNALLALNIDNYEMFELMTALICHQLYRYLLNRSSEAVNEHTYFIVDCMDGENTHIKNIAMNSFKRHVQIIQKSLLLNLEEIMERELTDVSTIQRWKQQAEASSHTDEIKRYEQFFIDINQSKRQKPIKTKLLEKLLNPDEQQAIELLRMELEALYLKSINEKQLAIFRTLGEDGSFLTPGSYKRYVMGDTLLNALVYAVLREKSQMKFADFLTVLCERYQIVIGPNEATSSGVYKKEGVNRKVYDDNERRLRAKLKRNGLLQEYSDATALVCNPYKVGRFI